MKNFELKIARELLGLTQSEAAQEIGKVSVRSWNYWESGDKNIPIDVQEKVNHLLERRKEIICFFLEKEQAKKTVIIYYLTPEYCQGILDWRFSQSLARTLALDFGATLIEFDPTSYFAWLNEKKMPDSSQSRSEWATERSKLS